MITSINPNNFKLVKTEIEYHGRTYKSVYNIKYYFSEEDDMLILETYYECFDYYVYYREPDDEYLGMVVNGSPSESIFDEPVSKKVKKKVKLNSELY